MGLFFHSVGQYKSSLYETARNLLRSRNNQRARAENRSEESRELRLRNQRLSQELEKTEKQLAQTQQLLQQQKQANEEFRQQPIRLPSDLAWPNHTYGPQMISLCLNLCQEIGFRPAATALKIVFDWLDIDIAIPAFDAMRTWSCRVGIAQLKPKSSRCLSWRRRATQGRA